MGTARTLAAVIISCDLFTHPYKYLIAVSPLIAGSYKFSVVYNSEHIENSPFTVIVNPALTDPKRTEIIKSPTQVNSNHITYTIFMVALQTCVAGQTILFQFRTLDCYGNPRTIGGDIFASKMVCTW